jgi:hypothetical protein
VRSPLDPLTFSMEIATRALMRKRDRCPRDTFQFHLPRGASTRALPVSFQQDRAQEPKWQRNVTPIEKKLDVIDNQVRTLRKRPVIESFNEGNCTGALLGNPH